MLDLWRWEMKLIVGRWHYRIPNSKSSRWLSVKQCRLCLANTLKFHNFLRVKIFITSSTLPSRYIPGTDETIARWNPNSHVEFAASVQNQSWTFPSANRRESTLFYMCRRLMICLILDFVTVVIQDNVGFGWGFGIPGAVMILAIITFNAGSLVYRYKVPRGSPLTSVAQVLVAAVRKRKATAGDDSSYLYEGLVEGQRPVELLAHTNQYRYVLLNT